MPDSATSSRFSIRSPAGCSKTSVRRRQHLRGRLMGDPAFGANGLQADGIIRQRKLPDAGMQVRQAVVRRARGRARAGSSASMPACAIRRQTAPAGGHERNSVFQASSSTTAAPGHRHPRCPPPYAAAAARRSDICRRRPVTGKPRGSTPGCFAGCLRLGEHASLLLDRREDRRLVHVLHAPPRAGVRVAARCSHSVTARPAKVGAWESQMPAGWQLDEHRAHVARIVFDPVACARCCPAAAPSAPSK